MEKQNQRVRLSMFEGLSEKELNTLYNLATIKRLQEDEVLIKEGDTDQTVYVVLDGQIRIVKDLQGQAKEISILREGDWIGEIAFTKQIPRTASAVANEPSSVMTIDKAVLNALDEKSQVFFLKKLNDLASERISGLATDEKELVDKYSQLAGKNTQLVEYICSARDRAKTDLGRSEAIQQIIKNTPRLPVFASTLASKLLKAQITPNEVAEMLKTDPSLVAVVLKTVNSSHYGFQKKVAGINHAIVLIGLNEIYQLVIAEGIRQMMPDTPTFREILSHSVAISHIAFTLSQESKVGKSMEMATIGLLHDLGHSAVQLLKEQKHDIGSLIGAIDHTYMGALLLKEWNLPDEVWQSVEFQSYPEFSPLTKIPVEVQNNVAILYLAHLCYRFFRGWTEQDMPTTFLDEYKRLLTWEKLSLADIVRKCVLPSLKDKISTFPESFRRLLNKYLQACELKTEGQPK